MSKISRRLLAKATVRLLREQPGRQAEIAKSLAAYLVANRQTHQLAALIQNINRELLVTEQVLYADVTSAFPLEAATRQAIERYLQVTTGARTVDLTATVDPDLLSGIILRTADQELNTSAQYKLKQLATCTTGGK